MLKNEMVIDYFKFHTGKQKCKIQMQMQMQNVRDEIYDEKCAKYK